MRNLYLFSESRSCRLSDCKRSLGSIDESNPSHNMCQGSVATLFANIQIIIIIVSSLQAARKQLVLITRSQF
jgi:hypothetical protein